MRIALGHLPCQLVALVAASIGLDAVAAPPTPAQIEFFETSVRPLLVTHCDRCHSSSATKVKGGLRLDSLAGMLTGGDTGPALVPGDPDHSLLITAIRYGNPDLEMPPKTKLPPEAIKVLEQWVKMGAPHPDALVPAGQPIVVYKVGIDIAKGRQFWSYVAPRKSAPPLVNDGAWVYSPIDQFVLAKVEEAGLHPAPDADRRSLIRRLTFDLIGLPPTPEEIDAFERDRAPDAYERLVDRLLASPRFGERWGRHWLWRVKRQGVQCPLSARVALPRLCDRRLQ
jgi:hypothetical protein